MKNRVVILPHQGMGDFILCNGIFRDLVSKGNKLWIIVRAGYSNSVSKMFADTPEVRILPLPKMPNGIWFRRLEMVAGFALGSFLRIFGFRFMPLGYLGKHFFGKGRTLRFDESFYSQAGVDFRCRWDSFRIDRMEDRWQEVIEALCPEGEFAFVHEDASRGYFVDRRGISENLRVVMPLGPDSGFEVWDYLGVILRASEIHVIESSFAALIESLQINQPKFAYRSARPEAKGDPNHEFTYKSDWKVVH